MEDNKTSYSKYVVSFILILVVACCLYFALRYVLQSDYNAANKILQKQFDELVLENSKLRNDFDSLDSAKTTVINNTYIIQQELKKEKDEIKNHTNSQSVEYFNAYINEYRNSSAN